MCQLNKKRSFKSEKESDTLDTYFVSSDTKSDESKFLIFQCLSNKKYISN